ncbi:ABC transporter permease [Nonomuraea sp. NPDC049480]|uniref:ABC transporter permease n=1 Tax=Nonomuraea sp. NPDC049480 TaxID=3364353 RepID=UPI00378B8855
MTARALLASTRVQLKSETRLAGVMAGVVQPAVFMAVTLLAAGQAATGARTAIGCGLLGLWGAIVWRFGLVLRQERQRGILPGIVSRPTGLVVVLIGKSIGSVLRSAALTVLTVGVVAAVAGHPVHIAAPVGFTLTALATLVSATALGLLLCSVFLLARSAVRIAETLIYPVFILGGLLVPTALLPGWAQQLSTLISLRWASELLLDAAAGGGQQPGDWLLLAATSAAYAVGAVVSLRVVLRRIHAEGTLELL